MWVNKTTKQTWKDVIFLIELDQCLIQINNSKKVLIQTFNSNIFEKLELHDLVYFKFLLNLNENLANESIQFNHVQPVCSSEEQVLVIFHVEMYEILDLLYLYGYKGFEVLGMKHLHLKQAINWLILTLMTCSNGYFKGKLGNFDDCLNMAWLISLTQLLTTSKACW